MITVRTARGRVPSKPAALLPARDPARGQGRGWPQPRRGESRVLLGLVLAFGLVLAARAASGPTILVQPVGGEVIAGRDFGFHVLADGTPPLAYQWYFRPAGTSGPTNRLEGETNYTLLLARVTNALSGTYWVVVTNTLGRVTSATATLEVSDPIILVQPAGATAEWHSSPAFRVEAEGTRPLTYFWLYRRSPGSNQTNLLAVLTTNALTLPPVTGADSGLYSVVVSNSAGTQRSVEATLRVLDPVILASPTGGVTTAGADFSFVVQAGGTEPLRYQWYFKNARLTNETGPALQLQAVRTNQSGNYFVVVTNGYSSATSAVAALTVYDLAILASPTNGAADFGASFTNRVVAQGAPPLSFQWYSKEAGAPTRTNRLEGETSEVLVLPGLTGARSGSYWVVVANGGGLRATSAAASLTVRDPLILAAPQSAAVEAGSNVTLSVTAAGSEPLRYQWQFNGQNLSGRTNASLTLTNARVTDSGSYAVRVSNAWGTNTSASAGLTVYDLVILVPPRSGWAIGGETVTNEVVARGPGLSYQWLFNGQPLTGATGPVLVLQDVRTTNSGPYSVVVSNRFGARTAGPANLAVLDPVIRSHPKDGSAVTGTNFSFTVVAGGHPPFTYRWTGPNFVRETTSLLPADELTLVNVQPANSGAYRVVVSNAWGSLTSADATLTVQSLAILQQPRDARVAAGGVFTNLVVAVGAPPLTYQWFFRGLPLPDQTGAELVLSNVTAAQAGAYTVDVRNPLATNRSATATLTVDDPAILTPPRGGRVVVGQDFRFEVEAAGTEPLTYQWLLNGSDLAGKVSRVLVLPDVTTSQGGQYSVRVRNASGTVTSATATLFVAASVQRRLALGRIAQLGSQVGVPLLLRTSGEENAVSFSLRYDSEAFSNPAFLTGYSNALVVPDFSQPGVLGLAMSLPGGETFRAGYRALGLVRFDLATGSDAFQGRLAFTNAPVAIAAGDLNNLPLPISAGVLPQYTLVDSNAQLNTQSGVFEQKLLISNPGATLLPGVNMIPLGLGLDSQSNTVTFFNAQGVLTSCPLNDCQIYVSCECYCYYYDPWWGYCYDYWYCSDEDCTVDFTGTVVLIPFAQITNLRPGESRLVTLEYNAPDHLTAPRPRYFVYPADPLPGLPPAGLTPVPITASRYATPGVFLVEFLTQAGRLYYVQYADTPDGLADTSRLKTAFPPVKGTGSRVQWTDNGPPRTDSPPVAGARFYRVLETP